MIHPSTSLLRSLRVIAIAVVATLGLVQLGMTSCAAFEAKVLASLSWADEGSPDVPPQPVQDDPPPDVTDDVEHHVSVDPGPFALTSPLAPSARPTSPGLGPRAGHPSLPEHPPRA